MDEINGNNEPEAPVQKSGTGFVEFLSSQRIINESVRRSGGTHMLLPIETMDLIIDKMIEFLLAKRNKPLEDRVLGNLKSGLRLDFDNASEWRVYFGRLCDYSDFFSEIRKKRENTDEIQEHVRYRVKLMPFLSSLPDLDDSERKILLTLDKEELGEFLKIRDALIASKAGLIDFITRSLRKL